MLSISTLWMSADRNIEDWLNQVKAMGINAIELGHGLKKERFEELAGLLEKVQIEVTSIHNFCPIPYDGPSPRHNSNYYRLSALDEQERQLAVKWTKNSVDTAKQLNAKAVVIHTGGMDFENERSPQLFALWKEGERGGEEFNAERERIIKLRDEKKGDYLKASEISLKEVTAYAKDQGIQIGLETRYYPLEIPNFEEMGYFLNIFDGPDVGYWHDVGHAEVTSRLGIKPHVEYLEAYKDRLIGAHIHGIDEARDHKAPFDGDMDLEALLPYFGPEVIRVIEPKANAPAELVKSSVSRLL